MRVLFLSYDGISDPLGKSQILPYIKGLVQRGHRIDILSFEKRDRFEREGLALRREISSLGINWYPQRYGRRGLGTLKNLFLLGYQSDLLHRKNHYDFVHGRSILPCLFAAVLRKRYALPFVFDMRGFWADERVDGNLWSLKNPLHRFLFGYFKAKEKWLLERCAQAVSLTEAAKNEILSWKLSSVPSFSVIPCSVDLEHFNPNKIDKKKSEVWRSNLALSASDFVVGYLGSLGTWYLTDEMLRCFRHIFEVNRNAKFLFITGDPKAEILKAAERERVPANALRFVSASREEVPELLALVQLGLFFIKPVYSKKASSATKCAEFLSMGIPVLSNKGVGDQDTLLGEARLGILTEDFNEASIEKAVAQIPVFVERSKQFYREGAERFFSLRGALDSYDRLYSQVVAPI